MPGVARKTSPVNWLDLRGSRKGTGLKPSLSMILPLRNDAGRLSLLFAQALDVLPELTPQWNLVLLDDGSSDATPEILDELARPYPQVSVIHNSVSEGDAACFRRSAQSTHGDLLLLRSSDCDLDLTGLDKMWKRAASHPLVVAPRMPTAVAREWRSARGEQRAAARTGPAIGAAARLGPWLAARGDQDLQAYLQAKRYPQHEVELRRWDTSTVATQNQMIGASASAQFLPQHCDSGDASGKPKRPNYLLRLKAFALGE